VGGIVGANNTLTLGSSFDASHILTLSDGGANTGSVTVGGNNGQGIFMIGSNNSTINANIRSNDVSNGLLTFGSSADAAIILTLSDTGLSNNGQGTGAVTITGRGGNGVLIHGGSPSANPYNPTICSSATNNNAVLTLGSSTLFPSTLVIGDNTPGITGQYVAVNNSTSTNMILQGATSTKPCTISTNLNAGSGGVVNIQSGITNGYPGISVADTSVAITCPTNNDTSGTNNVSIGTSRFPNTLLVTDNMPENTNVVLIGGNTPNLASLSLGGAQGPGNLCNISGSLQSSSALSLGSSVTS